MPKVLISDKLSESAIEIFEKNKIETSYNPGLSHEDLLKEMIDQLADDLASVYATGSNQGKITVTVEGLTEYRKYAEINKYFKNLSPVVSSSLKYMEQGLSRFDLRIEGQPNQFIEIVSLDGVLSFVKRSSEENEPLLVYKMKSHLQQQLLILNLQN